MRTAQSALRKAISKKESVGGAYRGFMSEVKEELEVSGWGPSTCDGAMFGFVRVFMWIKGKCLPRFGVKGAHGVTFVASFVASWVTSP